MDGRELMIVVNTALICGTVLVGITIRALLRRRDRVAPVRGIDALESRLARMEQAIDGVALEVERIAEGQRFTTKLLSESRAEAVPASRRVGS